ncbi:MAG TPA: DUF5819 family protein [Actinomycetota bacterium]|nr:DUF5819 family protein [Actinomycetota bacterium]
MSDTPPEARSANLFERLYPPALVLALVAVAVHFLLVAVTIPSKNPLSAAGDNFAVRYVDPALKQKWSLFAPDPLSGDIHLMGRARNHGGEWTEWAEFYTPVREEVRSSAFNPRALVRVHLIRSALIPLRDAMGKTAQETDLLLREWQDPDTKPAEVVSLERTAAGELAEQYPGRRFDQVQVRILLTKLAGSEDAGELLLSLTLREAPFESSVDSLGRP